MSPSLVNLLSNLFQIKHIQYVFKNCKIDKYKKIVKDNNRHQNQMRKSQSRQQKENLNLPKERDSQLSLQNPINDKILKFGKSIRARLSQKNQNTHTSFINADRRRVSQPLEQNSIILQNNCVRQSMIVQSDKPLLEDISKMSVSFIRRDLGFDDSKSISINCSKSSFSKSKSVRFCDIDRGDSASMSKSKRTQSILKNSNSSDKLSSNSVTSHVGSISGGLSIKASLKDKGIDCQNKKYQSTIKLLTHQSKKFFDDMFPPGSASLFHSKNLTNSRKDIRWMRVQDVFKGKKLVLFNHEDRNLIKSGQFPELAYMATCFNALGTSPRCLERIFQNQKYSQYGIYYLRLNHQGIWKYTIVDDYIPVRQVDKGFKPIFMELTPSKSNYVQIWPLILQKALAKTYSTYQCLFNDQIQNFMEQLTGVRGEKIVLDSQNAENNQLKIKGHLMSKNNIFLLSDCQQAYIQSFPQHFYALSQPKSDQNTYFTLQTQLTILPTQKHPSSTFPNFLQIQSLHTYFKNLTVYLMDDSHYSVGCVIKQQIGSFSLRTFKVQSYGRCVFSVIQKDRKYFRNNGYDYVWMRILLVQKDLDGYRYVNGVYSKGKVVYVDGCLNPGEYFILVYGDWNKKVYDITLNYQGNLQVQIKREPMTKFPNIIDQTCRDISQRFGTFIQINKNVCSYLYADDKLGLIIENFNNQIDRQVYFHRAYLIPISHYVSVGKAKFVEQQETSNKKNTGKSMERQLQTFLEADGNVTLVIMTIGGVNQNEFALFKHL